MRTCGKRIETAQGSLAAATVLLLAGVSAFPIAGCGGSREVDSKVQRQTSELNEISDMYHNYLRTTQRPPKQLSDLSKKEYEAVYTAGFHALHKGHYVAVWGVNSNDPSTVLAYEKDAPKNGGAVLMANGTVKFMTAGELKAAAKQP